MSEYEWLDEAVNHSDMDVKADWRAVQRRIAELGRKLAIAVEKCVAVVDGNTEVNHMYLEVRVVGYAVWSRGGTAEIRDEAESVAAAIRVALLAAIQGDAEREAGKPRT